MSADRRACCDGYQGIGRGRGRSAQGGQSVGVGPRSFLSLSSPGRVPSFTLHITVRVSDLAWSVKQFSLCDIDLYGGLGAQVGL
jgi:hypothetical protein